MLSKKYLSEWKQKNELLFEWRKSTRIFHKCHAQLSWYYYFWGRVIGLLATCLAASVSASIFTTLTKSENANLIIITGIISIITVISSAANDFLKLPETALRHSQAVSLFGDLRRDIEITLDKMKDKKISKKRLEEICKKWIELDKQVPRISNRIYEKIKREVEEEESGFKKNENVFFIFFKQMLKKIILKLSKS